jgi:predicted dehydrogenase
MTSNKVQVGIIGTGRVATYAHAPDYKKAGAHILAVADIAPGRAARFAEERDIPNAFTDYRDMLALPELDGVSVCVPPIAHEDVAVAALEAGKHVYLEKPPAMNEAEMVRIVDAARQAGRLLMAGSHMVYWNRAQTLKRAIDAGELGDIYTVKCSFRRRRGIPRGWFRQKRLSGGGVGMDGSSHALDLILYLLGTPQPVSVTARTYSHFASYIPQRGYITIDIEGGTETDVPEMDVEDTIVALVQFDSGCTLMLENTWAANTPPGGDLWFYGTQAGALWNPLTIYGEREVGVLTDTEIAFSEGPQTHEEALRHFAESIRQGKSPGEGANSPAERSIVTMRILDAIYKSGQNGGREVRFD